MNAVTRAALAAASFFCCGVLTFAFARSAFAQQQAAVRLPLTQEVRPFPYADLKRGGEGNAVMRFHIDAQGKTSAVQVVEVDEAVRQLAVSTATYWKFPAGAEEDRTVTMHFRLADAEFDDEVAALKLTHTVFVGPNEVTLTSLRHMTTRRSQCPGDADVRPGPKASPVDFVEIQRTHCYGSCPAYTLRLLATGEIRWSGLDLGYRAESAKPAEARIAPAEAQRVLREFDSPAFWSACGDYESHWTDNPTVFLRASIGGRTKEIRDYGSAATPFLEGLPELLDDATDSHRWRVGDPASESLSMISTDAWYAKPGKTPLMKAVSHFDDERVAALLATHPDMNAVDASGWTALMYATGIGHQQAVKALLAAHADVTQRGPRGESVLHFLPGWNKDLLPLLVAAGADVNVAMTDGTTPLMMQASEADVDNVRGLLLAGAKATAKDAEGRTALDYVIAKSCGLAVHGAETHMVYPTKNGCDALNPEPLAQVKSLLEKAGAQQTRQWMPANQTGIPAR